MSDVPHHPPLAQITDYHRRLVAQFWAELPPDQITFVEGAWVENRRCPGCGKVLHRECFPTIAYTAPRAPTEASVTAAPVQPPRHRPPRVPVTPAADESEELFAIADFTPTRLWRRRLALGLTREQLATQAGLSPKTIFNLETARHRATDIVLKKLCAVEELKLRPVH